MLSIKNNLTYHFWNMADYFNYPSTSEIIQNIHIGNIAGAYWAEHNNFDVIINASTDIPNYYNNITFKKNIEYKNVIVDDNCTKRDFLNMETQLEDIVDFIDSKVQQNKKILVHCRVGAQRSCTIVAGYLIKYKNMSVAGAVYLIKNKRNIAFNGYNHFEPVLEHFYNKLISFNFYQNPMKIK